MDRQPRAAHLLLHAPDFLGYPGRDRAGRGPPRRRRTRPGAEEGRQRDPRAGRRSRDPPGQLAGRRLLPRPRPTPSSRRWPSAAPALDARARHGALGGRLRLPRRRARRTSCWPCTTTRRTTRSRAATVATTTRSAFAVRRIPDHVVEHQVPHSTALHARSTARPLPDRAAGPLLAQRRAARPLGAAGRASAAGLGASCRNPFRSIVVRAVEVVYAVEEALRIIDGYEPPAAPARRRPAARAAVGHGVERGAARACCTTATSSTPTGCIAPRDDRAADLAEPGRDRGRPAPAWSTPTSTCPTTS